MATHYRSRSSSRSTSRNDFNYKTSSGGPLSDVVIILCGPASRTRSASKYDRYVTEQGGVLITEAALMQCSQQELQALDGHNLMLFCPVGRAEIPPDLQYLPLLDKADLQRLVNGSPPTPSRSRRRLHDVNTEEEPDVDDNASPPASPKYMRADSRDSWTGEAHRRVRSRDTSRDTVGARGDGRGAIVVVLMVCAVAAAMLMGYAFLNKELPPAAVDTSMLQSQVPLVNALTESSRLSLSLHLEGAHNPAFVVIGVCPRGMDRATCATKSVNWLDAFTQQLDSTTTRAGRSVVPLQLDTANTDLAALVQQPPLHIISVQLPLHQLPSERALSLHQVFDEDGTWQPMVRFILDIVSADEQSSSLRDADIAAKAKTALNAQWRNELREADNIDALDTVLPLLTRLFARPLVLDVSEIK